MAGLRERIMDAVAQESCNVVTLAATLGVDQKITKMNVGHLVNGGRLAYDGDSLVVADEPPPARTKVPAKRGNGHAPAEPEHEILFAADEDGDLQLSRRDGEGEILCIPSAELARLVAFVKRNFKDVLRG